MGTKLSDVLTGMYMQTEAARNLHFHTAGFDVEVEMPDRRPQLSAHDKFHPSLQMSRNQTAVHTGGLE